MTHLVRLAADLHKLLKGTEVTAAEVMPLPYPTEHVPPLGRAAGLLTAAVKRIEQSGWFQGDLWPNADDFEGYIDSDPCCVIGAVASAAGIEDGYDVAQQLQQDRSVFAAAVRAIAVELHGARQCAGIGAYDLAGDVVDWNDTEGRTAVEVAAVLRSAGEHLAHDEYLARSGQAA